MNWKKSFYDVINNKKPQVISFIPRFDLWYNVHSQKKPKPGILEGINSLNEFSRSLGLIPYSNIPDFTAGGDIKRVIHRSLGFYNLKQCPYKISFGRTKVNFKHKDSYTYVEYITPIGSIDTEFIFTEEMKKSGASISWIKKRLITKKEDYKICKYIFDDMVVEENYKEFDEYIKEQGDDYIPIAYGILAVSGMQHIMRDFLEVTDFFLHFMDNRKELEMLAGSIDKKIGDIIKILAKSGADIILVGANFDSTVTYAPFYKGYILPKFKEYSNILHENNKKIISHCDGENDSLWELYIDSDIDILEAVAIKPMVKQSLEEIVNIIGDRAVIWGAVDSIALLDDSMSDSIFRKYVENIVDIAKENRIILGISDTAPVNMNIDRVLYIRDFVIKKSNK